MSCDRRNQRSERCCSVQHSFSSPEGDDARAGSERHGIRASTSGARRVLGLEKNYARVPSESATKHRRTSTLLARLASAAGDKHENASREPGAVEEVRGKADHRLGRGPSRGGSAGCPLPRRRETRRPRQHDRHAPGPDRPRTGPMVLKPSAKSPLEFVGRPSPRHAPGSFSQTVADPLFKRVRRIGHDDTNVARHPSRVGEDSAPHPKRVPRATRSTQCREGQVHARDCRGREIFS